MTRQRISEIPREERPSYKIEQYPYALSSRELLALLIGGENQMEIANDLYKACDGNLRSLGKEFTPEDIEGIGKATADRILAAVQLGQKLASPVVDDRPIIHSPEDAADLVQYEMSGLTQEELRVIILNTRNRVIKIVTIYRGSLNSSQIRVGEIFRSAIRLNAAAIIVAHNHPSKTCDPSTDDIGITRAIIKAGKLLGIELLDHLIIGGSSFISLNRRGLGFEGEQQFCLDCQKESDDSNKVEDKEKRVVAMSKPFPKMLQDLKESERKSPGAVQLVVGKKGNVIATTLRDHLVEKEINNEQQ
jgi:DNA repair protein RadC